MKGEGKGFMGSVWEKRESDGAVCTSSAGKGVLDKGGGLSSM